MGSNATCIEVNACCNRQHIFRDIISIGQAFCIIQAKPASGNLFTPKFKSLNRFVPRRPFVVTTTPGMSPAWPYDSLEPQNPFFKTHYPAKSRPRDLVGVFFVLLFLGLVHHFIILALSSWSYLLSSVHLTFMKHAHASKTSE